MAGANGIHNRLLLFHDDAELPVYPIREHRDLIGHPRKPF